MFPSSSSTSSSSSAAPHSPKTIAREDTAREDTSDEACAFDLYAISGHQARALRVGPRRLFAVGGLDDAYGAVEGLDDDDDDGEGDGGDAYAVVKMVRALTPMESLLLAEEEAVDLTGHRVWLGAQVMVAHVAQWFGDDGAGDYKKGKVLELGSGTGLVGIACAMMGFEEVTLTDGESSVVKLLQENVRLNGLEERCKVKELRWTESSGDHHGDGEAEVADLVLASDCVYDVGVLPSMLDTARRFCKVGAQVHLCNCQNRLFLAQEEADRVMVEAAASRGLKLLEKVDLSNFLKPESDVAKEIRQTDQEISLLVFVAV